MLLIINDLLKFKKKTYLEYLSLTVEVTQVVSIRNTEEIPAIC